ncbi:hypothetical protein EVAR_62268_1 [Eumeta japonica]|uniref:Uncharacterized protein n=1 Tax=Eumeta variegata TaxID=151549 RepID=A0A4C1YVQ2_EUMVA|nr:hypothetical protein EVAR_62268_1 [Eumeta japonica]
MRSCPLFIVLSGATAVCTHSLNRRRGAGRAAAAGGTRPRSVYAECLNGGVSTRLRTNKAGAPRAAPPARNPPAANLELVYLTQC